ncbi:MAG TPA: prepilin peptidase [Patescibacteria group bacterium]|nr:prepilin peptidase [Patescibacteria group bacterium]
MILGAILAVCFGAIFGSFINALIYRVHDRSTLWGRSVCESCSLRIQPRHLVPIFSWLWLHGRCPHCKRKIHIHHPIVEGLSAIFAGIVFFRHPFIDPAQTVLFCFEFFFILNLLFLSAFDWRWKLLPIEWMVASFFLFSLCGMALGLHSVLSVIIGALFGFGFLGIQTALSKGTWMGAGDPWLGALIGGTLGWPLIAVSYYLTYVGGALVVIPFFMMRRISVRIRLPFAPLLSMGAIGALWFGDQLVNVIRHWWGG